MQRDVARQVLGVAPDASAADVERAFRCRAQDAHPDRGGDPETFRLLVTARRVLAAPARPGGAGGAGGTASGAPLTVRHTGHRAVLRRLRFRFPVYLSTPRVR